MLRICIKNLILGFFLAASIFLQGIEAFRTQNTIKKITTYSTALLCLLTFRTNSVEAKFLLDFHTSFLSLSIS